MSPPETRDATASPIEPGLRAAQKLVRLAKRLHYGDLLFVLVAAMGLFTWAATATGM